MCLLFTRDPASSVTYRDNGNVIMHGQNHVNVSARVVKLDGIVEKIEQKPPDLPGVKCAYYILLHSSGNFDSTLAGLPAHAVHCRLYQLGKVFLFPVKLDLLTFRLC